MKRQIRKIICVTLATLLAFCCLTACGKKGDKGKTQSVLPAVDREKWALGLDEIASDTYLGGEVGATSEWCASMAGALGAKSQRIWMSLPDLLERAENSNALTLNKDACDAYHNYFRLLKAAGVERLVSMHNSLLHPYGFVNITKQVAVGLHPKEDVEFYADWIQMYYDAYWLLAKEFPEIGFWECGNEFDMYSFFHKNDGTAFSAEDAAWIVADLCYAANKAVKAVNPSNAVVLPGLSSEYSSHTFLQCMYEAIESATLPTLERYAVTDPDSYFDILAWHPYGRGIPENFRTYCLELRDIAVAHGDAEKRVWITEMGISEAWKRSEDVDAQTAVANSMREILTIFRDELTFAETFFVFRLTSGYSYTFSDQEDNFGIFYSPDDPVHRGKPKPVALTVFRFFNGENADASLLYSYCEKFGITA